MRKNLNKKTNEIKILPVLLSLCLMILSSSCSDAGPDSRNTGSVPGVSEILEDGMKETEKEDSQERQRGVSENAPVPEDVAEDTPLSATEGIDIDLTMLSGTMIYSEVYSMMVSPEDYTGKTVKLSGAYAHYYDEATENHYYACIIQDAAACCTQGMEFVLADENYPSEEGTEITVSGVFETYTEGNARYCTLRNAKLW